MARAARMIGDGGVLGWLFPETVEFPDDAFPTSCVMQLGYKISGEGAPIFISFRTDTTFTQTAIRVAAKDTIRADIIERFGVTIPRANIKMTNSLE